MTLFCSFVVAQGIKVQVFAGLYNTQIYNVSVIYVTYMLYDMHVQVYVVIQTQCNFVDTNCTNISFFLPFLLDIFILGEKQKKQHKIKKLKKIQITVLVYQIENFSSRYFRQKRYILHLKIKKKNKKENSKKELQLDIFYFRLKRKCTFKFKKNFFLIQIMIFDISVDFFHRKSPNEKKKKNLFHFRFFESNETILFVKVVVVFWFLFQSLVRFIDCSTQFSTKNSEFLKQKSSEENT
eukprot:TRINITY_DN1111_c1_g1_i9.p1 TRINITY_DN1111_c1_g1~~TRINITY_DN1111_c1_g1_i9.p1  ORF type:complete len:238 (-),score=0.44 TRINITY_DN1111_c1_g1_i9:643-1356(-)